jgi:predicted DCC family thiol-disulfide oxidoreductase YuxK
MSNAFFLLIKIQVVLVYLSAGIYKLGGSLWQNGMALYYILQSESYGHPMLAKLMVEFPILSLIGTYATLLFQITFPWLVWNKKLRPFYILWGFGLHLGMIFAMGLLTFGSNMCLMFLVFFKDSYYQNITNFLKSFKNGPIEVGIDENCGICNKFSKIIQKLDFYQLVKIDRAHNPVSTNLQSIEKVKRLNAIVVFTEKNETFYWGMGAIAQIIYKLPFGFLLKPLFYILKFKSFDKKIYTKIANSQMRKNCAEGFCNV